MVVCVADVGAVKGMAVVAREELRAAAPLRLGYRVCAGGEAVVAVGGELDVSTVEAAVSYVSGVIDRHRGPVVVDLAGLSFCDARGLGGLVRMAGYAGGKGCRLRLACASPSLVTIMRITGLDGRFVIGEAPALGRVPPDRAGRCVVVGAGR